jgi:hypothetical protein
MFLKSKVSNSMQQENNFGKEVILRSAGHVVNRFYSLRLFYFFLIRGATALTNLCVLHSHLSFIRLPLVFICCILGRDPGLETMKEEKIEFERCGTESVKYNNVLHN